MAGSLKGTKLIVLRVWHAALKRHGAAKMASMGGDKTMMVSQIETESKHFSWGLEDKPFQGGPTLLLNQPHSITHDQPIIKNRHLGRFTRFGAHQNRNI